MASDLQPVKKKRRRKRRRKASEYPIQYLVQIEDWEWGLSFGVSINRHFDDPYMDFRHLHITGALLQPRKVKAEKAKITLMPDADLNEENRQRHQPKAVGSIDLFHGNLTALLSMPQDALDSVLQMLAAGKFKYLIMTGDKLRYRKALVRSYALECDIDPDDYPEDED